MKQLKKDFKNGISKKDAFISFCERGGNAKKGARFLAAFPDKEEAEKYSKLNRGLVVVYVILIVLGMINLVPMLSGLSATAILFILSFALIIPAAIIMLLIQKQAMAYLALGFFMVKGILDSLKSIEQDPVAVYVGIGINILVLGYAILLKLKLFPYQNFINNKKDDSGNFIYTKI